MKRMTIFIAATLCQCQTWGKFWETTSETVQPIYVYKDSVSAIEDGSITSPYKTLQAGINAGIATRKEVWVAKGATAYVEQISFSETVTIYGGYSSSFVRNVAANPTIITATASPVVMISGTTNASTFDGFTIQGSQTLATLVQVNVTSASLRLSALTVNYGNCNSGLSCTGVYFAPGATATLQDSTLNGTQLQAANITGFNRGIWVQNATPTIKNSTLTMGGVQGAFPGAGTNVASGIYVDNFTLGGATSVTIQSNSITGASATGGAAYLVHGVGGSMRLLNNEISGTNVIYGDTVGLVNMTNSTIAGNRVFTATASDNFSANGVYIVAGNNIYVYNNVILAGTNATGGPVALWFQNQNNAPGTTVPNPTFVATNNLLIATAGTGAHAMGANNVNNPVHPVVVNNILVGTGGANSACYQEQSPGSSTTALQFEYNMLINCNARGYYANGTTPNTTPVNIATAVGGGGGQSSSATINIALISSPIASLFLTNYQTTKAGVFTLTASTPAFARQEGLNTSQQFCGVGNTLSCGAITTDLSGKTRSCPTAFTDCYSLGAYEYP